MSDEGLDDLIRDLDSVLESAKASPAPPPSAPPTTDDLTEAARRTVERSLKAADAAARGQLEPRNLPGRPASAGSDAIGPLDLVRSTALDKVTRDRWRRLFETSALLNSTRFDLDLILVTVVDVAVQLTSARRGILFFSDEEGSLTRSLGRDDARNQLHGAGLDVPRTVINRVVETREPLFIPRFADSPLRRSESVASLGLHSAMCVPLAVTPTDRIVTKRPTQERRRYVAPAPSDLLGVLYVDSDSSKSVFGEEDLMFFLALAHHATTAILNANLYRQAITDPLTRLFARRHFNQALDEAQRRHQREGTPVSLLMIDVDHFKRVNDRHGHVAGDQVLRRFAELLRATLRADDEAFRYGGEEFAVLLADTDEGGSMTLAEKLRRRIEEESFTDRQIRVTTSIGIATLPVHAKDTAALVKRADQALYQAKAEGRNRCRAFTTALGGAARQDPLAGVFTGVFARDYDNVRLLIETFEAISSGADISALLTQVIDKVIEATDATRGALMLRDKGHSKLRTLVARTRGRAPLPETERLSRSVPARVLETGESVCIIEGSEGEPEVLAGPDDGRAKPRSRSASFKSASIAEMELRTVMCVPLATRERTIGVLYVDSRAVGERLRESSLPFFEALGRHLALALENVRLRAQLRIARAGGSAPEA